MNIMHHEMNIHNLIRDIHNWVMDNHDSCGCQYSVMDDLMDDLMTHH